LRIEDFEQLIAEACAQVAAGLGRDGQRSPAAGRGHRVRAVRSPGRRL
jgi:hypothetical protein